MQKTPLHLAIAISLLLVGLIAVRPVFANSADQWAEQHQESTTECTYGAYGQNGTCKVTSNQTQKMSQKIAYTRVLGTTTKYHVPVDTAVDATALAAIALTGLTGVGAFAGYLKLRQ